MKLKVVDPIRAGAKRMLRFRWMDSAIVVMVTMVLMFCDNRNSVGRTVVSAASEHSYGSSEFWVPHVRKTLNVRLEEVMDGRREAAVRKHFRKQRKQNNKNGNSVISRDALSPTVISSHGRKTMDSHVRASAEDNSKDAEIVERRIVIPEAASDSVFPSDVTCLDILQHTNDGIFVLKERDQNGDQDLTPWKLSMRAIELSWNFSPAIWTSWLAILSTNYRERHWYSTLVNCIGRSGPAFIKWGQWASTRSDIFPKSFCDALSHLHNDAPSHDWEVTQKTVEKSLQIPPNSLRDVFSEFDPKPIASGSIAQIHRAKLCPQTKNNNTRKQQQNDENNWVAVKVRHPKVASLIRQDFFIFTKIASIIPVGKDIQKTVEQFCHTMASQAHLEIEAHHLEVLNHNFAKWNHVSFPKPIYASSSVIIETFQKGHVCTAYLNAYEKVNSDDHLDMPTVLQKFIVTSGLAIYLKMLLVDNLMHADLHPGNIMLDVGFFHGQPDDGQIIHPDGTNKKTLLTNGGGINNIRGNQMKVLSSVGTVGTKKNKELRTGKRVALRDGGHFCGHLTLVDAGMVAQLDPNESTNFVGLCAALGEGDAVKAATYILQFTYPQPQDAEWYTHEDGLFCQISPKQRIDFTNDMVELFSRVCGGYGCKVDVGEVLRGVLELLKHHSIRIDANYATLVVNILCIEGMGKRICPSYNVLDASKPLLQSHNRFLSLRSTNYNRQLLLPKKIRRCMIRAMTKVLYMKKNWKDNQFFNQLQQKRLQVSSQEHQKSDRVLKAISFLFNNTIRLGSIYIAIQQSSKLVTGNMVPISKIIEMIQSNMEEK